ncbi:hypothetical protein EUGRSUZ_E00201 [Eucalyptus grandis]|uniref:Uncharacterized protein n=2 Tax=Eucalyptus grandis TaxID=71139 RepID=A0ACC3KQQ7_EUCGR|nr:hypothetical protein EUGRSUZ_E00201 [Eucalyptus grandis]
MLPPVRAGRARAVHVASLPLRQQILFEPPSVGLRAPPRLRHRCLAELATDAQQHSRQRSRSPPLHSPLCHREHHRRDDPTPRLPRLQPLRRRVSLFRCWFASAQACISAPAPPTATPPPCDGRFCLCSDQRLTPLPLTLPLLLPLSLPIAPRVTSPLLPCHQIRSSSDSPAVQHLRPRPPAPNCRISPELRASAISDRR